MHTTEHQGSTTIIRARGSLSEPEVAAIALDALRERADGFPVIVDVSGVSHVEYAGARRLLNVPEIRVAGASRYVRDLIRAASGVHVEFYPTVEEAQSAP